MATIVEKVLEEFRNDRDLLRNRDWVLTTLYDYMQSRREPQAETNQDCIWAAQRLQPNVSSWEITKAQYDEACARLREHRRKGSF